MLVGIGGQDSIAVSNVLEILASVVVRHPVEGDLHCFVAPGLACPKREMLAKTLGRKATNAFSPCARPTIEGRRRVAFFVIPCNPHPTVAKLLETHARTVVTNNKLPLDDTDDRERSRVFRRVQDDRSSIELKGDLARICVVGVLYEFNESGNSVSNELPAELTNVSGVNAKEELLS
jgi:hypothetical protein